MKFGVKEGAIYTAQKVVIYGPEGIGKTTLARQFPDPVFIDTEESSKGYAVKRITRPDGGVRPDSWTMLLEMAEAVRDGAIHCKTLVVDSLDWAEALCVEHICSKNKKDGIEDFGYGKGYTYLEEQFGKLLNTLSEVVGRGIHVVCTAHAAMRRVELPEETGAYDHWELKLEKKTASLVKEWADMVLFCNYKTIVISGNNPMEKNKAAGGKRVMHAVHTPWWDAKNRHQLPDDMDMDYTAIAHIFTVQPAESSPTKAEPMASPAPTPPSPPEPPKTAAPPEPAAPTTFRELEDAGPVPFFDSSAETPPEGVPPELWHLMQADGITVEQVQGAVAQKGYYPAGTPIKNYDPQFISGCLIAAWNQVKSLIA